MADLLIHEHKKNDTGSYDNVYRKTKAKLVDTEDGGTAEQKFATMANHIADKNNPHNVTAAQVGAIPSSQKGVPSGVAELDSTGKVPSTQLPSYVDDVLEYGSNSAFPVPGEEGKIYIATDTNLSYRWSGSQYVEISPSIALGETSSTAYRGDRGKVAYDHISNTNNPHGVTAEQVGARPNTWTPNASDVGADPVGSSAAVQGNLDTHIQNKQNPHSVTADQIGAAKPGYVFYITLLASNWVDNSQTVSDIGFVTSGYAYLINPSDEDFISWNDCIVRGKDVEQAGKMNFICEEQPSSDIVVKIVRMEVSA